MMRDVAVTSYTANEANACGVVGSCVEGLSKRDFLCRYPCPARPPDRNECDPNGYRLMIRPDVELLSINQKYLKNTSVTRLWSCWSILNVLPTDYICLRNGGVDQRFLDEMG